MLAPVDERVLLEVARDAARGRQRQAEYLRQLADGRRFVLLGADVHEHRDVPRADRRVATEELPELRRRAAAAPEAAEDGAERPAQPLEL